MNDKADNFGPKFTEWVKETEQDAVAADAFKPKVLWIVDDMVRLSLWPDGDLNGGDWVGLLPRPLAMVSASIDNVDKIVVLTDSCYTTSPTKHDGTGWEHGDMQEALRDPDSADHDRVKEVLLIMTVTSTAVTQTSILYDRNADGTITWGKAETYSTDDPGLESMGRLPDALRGSLKAPKLGEAMKQMFGNLGLTDKEAAAHALCAVVKMVMNEYHWVAMVGTADEAEAEIFDYSMNHGPFSENIRAFNKQAMQEINDLEESLDLPDYVKEESNG